MCSEGNENRDLDIDGEGYGGRVMMSMILLGRSGGGVMERCLGSGLGRLMEDLDMEFRSGEEGRRWLLVGKGMMVGLCGFVGSGMWRKWLDVS
uniref:hypothetical protein n=1 Tax=Staphylococcus auricularis TaxID=29379 RepID=UPI001249219A